MYNFFFKMLVSTDSLEIKIILETKARENFSAEKWQKSFLT